MDGRWGWRVDWGMHLEPGVSGLDFNGLATAGEGDGMPRFHGAGDVEDELLGNGDRSLGLHVGGKADGGVHRAGGRPGADHTFSAFDLGRSEIDEVATVAPDNLWLWKAGEMKNVLLGCGEFHGEGFVDTG